MAAEACTPHFDNVSSYWQSIRDTRDPIGLNLSLERVEQSNGTLHALGAGARSLATSLFWRVTKNETNVTGHQLRGRHGGILLGWKRATTPQVVRPSSTVLKMLASG